MESVARFHYHAIDKNFNSKITQAQPRQKQK